LSAEKPNGGSLFLGVRIPRDQSCAQSFVLQVVQLVSVQQILHFQKIQVNIHQSKIVKIKIFLFRRCKSPSRCHTKVEQEEAFCFVKDSFCFKWLYERVCATNSEEEEYDEYYGKIDKKSRVRQNPRFLIKICKQIAF